MEPNEARTRILSEHARLRERLDELAERIERFEAGSREVGGELRSLGVSFFEAFAAHIALEDAALVPALDEEGERGKRLAEQLVREHEEQRELLHYLLARLEGDSRPSMVVARELHSFVEYVRQDMKHEEETILREDLFPDR